MKKDFSDGGLEMINMEQYRIALKQNGPGWYVTEKVDGK